MTRKATAKDMEMKLKQSLIDLKVSRDLCDQLIQEREEGEHEIVKILEKNKELKQELAELHVRYMDVQEKCDLLQQNVDSFSACSNTHEQALNRINFLETSLSEAHNNMKQLQNQLSKDNNIDLNSQSLFSEFTYCDSELTADNLTKQLDTCDYSASRMHVCSIKKLKKYIRISRFINKSKKLIKQQNHLAKHIQLRKERKQLLEKLKYLENCALNSSNNYNNVSVNFETKIDDLEHSMKTMFKNIQSMSQKVLNNQLRANNDMEDMCNFNADRFESLNKKRSCRCAIDSDCHNDGKAECLIREQRDENISVNLSNNNTELHAVLSDTQFTSESQQEIMFRQCDLVTNNKTLVFSDQIGVGLSSIINNHTSNTVINHCMPGAPLSHIVDCICAANTDINTIVILCVGNSNKIKTREIKKYFTKLNNVICKKIIWCALPYSVSLKKNANDRIFALNRLIHHLISRHSDRFSWFDNNVFIKQFNLTKTDDMYLAKRCKHNIATLLANIINTSFNDLVSNRLTTGTEDNSFLVK